MKYIMLFFLYFCCVASFAQTNSTTLTMNGIGNIKVGMSQAALEKLIGQPIKLKNASKEEWYMDTLLITYKDVPYEVLFTRETPENQKPYMAVYEVKSNSSLVKTKSGISIGDDKLKIISTYEGYSIHITPTYEGDDYSIKSKTKSTVTLYSDEGNNVIIFYLENNKVTAMSVGVFEGC